MKEGALACRGKAHLGPERALLDGFLHTASEREDVNRSA
ncbi:hypothetical protein BQ8482_160119 [Mesorhizobium delmotii]|uniref:Uncharacterized protein n=1 Tax=Mesorhizobium delmotii TaxID=1631247 RepID=A0A2P9AHM3_9HYPH|nr:hypothetical protein BQ8482_160119 [Mesorhizobium delmotii]